MYLGIKINKLSIFHASLKIFLGETAFFRFFFCKYVCREYNDFYVLLIQLSATALICAGEQGQPLWLFVSSAQMLP